jgi:hypothetical protein
LPPSNPARRFAARLHEERWLIVFVLAALVVRLHWNLVVHPPGDFVYSDMRGYVTRAEGLFDDPWGRWEYSAFYPYGTHVLVHAVQAVFGRGEIAPVGVLYAVLGGLEVGFGYALARRVSRYAFVPPIVGALLVAYYPLISLGGYVLSETPFSFCLVASTFFLVRTMDTGRRSDALLAGLFAAIGFTFRPQLVLSIAFFFGLWVLARKVMPRITLPRLLWAAAPLLVVFAFSAWRMHYHTGRWGLISENGAFNRVFGRCHNEKIIALPDTPERRRTSFGPPPLIQLAKRTEKLPGQWPQLEPVLGREIEYRGYIGDKDILKGLMQQCVEATGMKKQAEFGLVHATMLWRYNIMWPDSGKGFWREYAQLWGTIHANVFMVPTLLGLLLVFVPRRHPKAAVLALHGWAIIVIAVLHFGDVRLRTPYDPILILLALEVYALVGVTIGRRVLSRVRQRHRPAIG